MRTYWDVVVDDGHDAANIDAHVNLPIDTHTNTPSTIVLDGPVLGWAGSGTFNHFESTQKFNGYFRQAWTWWGWTAVGLPTDAVEVLSTSRIEIDYLLPPGDFNGDGKVEQEDLTMLLVNWGSTRQPEGWTVSWDGALDQNELTDLMINWGLGSGGTELHNALVPEPATVTLLMLGGLAAGRCRRMA